MRTTTTRRRARTTAVPASRWLRRVLVGTPGSDPVHPAGTTRRTHHSAEPAAWHLGGVGR